MERFERFGSSETGRAGLAGVYEGVVMSRPEMTGSASEQSHRSAAKSAIAAAASGAAPTPFEMLERRQLLSAAHFIRLPQILEHARDSHHVEVQQQSPIAEQATVKSTPVKGEKTKSRPFYPPTIIAPAPVSGISGGSIVTDQSTAGGTTTDSSSTSTSNSSSTTTGSSTSGSTTSGSSSSNTPTVTTKSAGGGSTESSTPATPTAGVTVTYGLNTDIDTMSDNTPATTETITGPSSGASAPVPAITILGGNEPGPHAVFVNALSSNLEAGTCLTAHYSWNFGDTGSEFNTLVGWNASHYYANPGVYPVTLTLTNENGLTSTVTTDITITGDSRRSIYVDSSGGNDSNTGTSPSNPIQSFGRLQQLLGDNVNVYLKSGDTFNVYSSLSVWDKNVTIEPYGSGPAPVIMRYAGSGLSAISMGKGTENVNINGLDFESPYVPTGVVVNKVPANGVDPGGIDVSIRNCLFLNVTDAFNENSNPQGTLIQDCSSPSPTGLRGCFIWGQGTDQVYLNNFVANSTREHCIRTVWVIRELIAYNNLTNLDRTALGDWNDISKGTIDVHRGSYAYVANNWVYDGELRVGPRNGPSVVKGDITQWTVVEDNHIFNHYLQVYPGTYHLMVRNNIITIPNVNQAVDVVASYPDGDTNQDLTFANNTAYTTQTGGTFFKLGGGGRPDSVTLINNLWIAPNVIPGENASSGVDVVDSTGDQIALSTHNVWEMPGKFNPYADGGINLIWPTWDPPNGYYTPANWNDLSFVKDDYFYSTAYNPSTLAPATSSFAATAGEQTPGVQFDIYGNPRPASGPITAGAVQVG